MDTLKVFENPAFGGVRTITDEDGKILFCALDIAHPLGYQRERDAVQRHCRYAVKRGVPHPQNPEKQIEMTFIPEGDVYRLIARSNLPEAQKFESWIFDEVVPAIRRTGGYIAGAEKMTDAEIMAQAVLVANRTIEARDARIRELEAQAKADAPKVLYADAVAASEGGMLIREFAKFLRDNGADMGEKRLFEDMRKRGFLIKAEGRDRNTPTQRAMDMGLFTVKETVIQIPLLGAKTRTTPLLTGKGKLYFMNLYLKERDAAPVAEAAT